MKTMKLLLVAIIATGTLVFTGCAKKGDTGPAGKDGNANVQSTMLTMSAGWTWDSGNFWRYAQWSPSILTQDVVNNGAVMVYQQVGTQYVALPISENITGSVTEHDFFQYGVGSITVFIENSDLSDPNPPLFTYKLVCIPKSGMIKHPNVDITNYEQVRKEFNLKD